MNKLYYRFVVLATIASQSAVAQTAQRATDPVFVRAQELVSDGNGAAGRAVIDSVLKSNSPQSRIYPQALFWRASLAASAADAESDYKHLVVDYPLAPEAEDALLRLAQLELARGDRDAALAHLQRIPRDYPQSKSLARASYWTARVLFEKNDIPGACTANASALGQVASDEIELQNQIQYQGQRCVAYNASKSTAASPAVASSSTASATASSTSSTASERPVTPTVTERPPAREDSTHDVAVEPVRESPRAAEKTARPKSTPAPAPKASSAKPSPISDSGFSVQVAAYTKRAEAEKLTKSLVGRGYDARVDGQSAPFRVRIGRYQSAKEAEAALARIKAKHMEGFVVKAPAK
jgi:cell division protein FtsN